MTDNTQLLSVKKVAEILSLCKEAVYDQVACGEIKSIRVGKNGCRIRIHPDEVARIVLPTGSEPTPAVRHNVNRRDAAKERLKKFGIK
jgi:excisionase family DNA binding protein